jgi:hypothetical protein
MRTRTRTNSASALVSQPKPFRKFLADTNERSAVKKIIVFVCLLAGSRAFADTIVNEKFAADPLQNGWQIFGETNLFAWDSTNNALDVTWDSSRPNSYFYHPLGATFTKADSFCVIFDLALSDAVATGYFELAAGLCNFAEATSPTFSRANFNSPDLLEFDYFPDGPMSYGPSLDATLIDESNGLYFAFDASQPMTPDATYHIVLIHRAGESAVSGTVYTNGRPFTVLPGVRNYGADDFHLDTLALCNYTTTDDSYGDSLSAHGVVGHFAFASPLPICAVTTPAPGQIELASDTNWLYTLEQSADLQIWSPAAPPVLGNGTNLWLQATNPPTDNAFYRVRADLP